MLQNIKDLTKFDYEKSREFFYSEPIRNTLRGTSEDKNGSYFGDQGAVQFHIIGQKTDKPEFSKIMNENQTNLLSMGGLVHKYMQNHYPTITDDKLDVDIWKNVVGHLPSLSIGSSVDKKYSNSIQGVKISGNFLGLVADAIITSGGSLLTDFKKYLSSIGDITFNRQVKSQEYKVLTCTYQSYLVDNQAGGYFDYGAIVLRQINFLQNFKEFKSSCSSASSININMEYKEVTNIVQCSRIRDGGPDYKKFKDLVDTSATNDFKEADSFFNGSDTPENDIKPKVK
ncbi:MAG: hypothetical protein ABF289_03960 [Clostridiales bacterium]